MTRIRSVGLVLGLIVVAFLVGGHCTALRTGSPGADLKTPYQAVVLTGGQVYFGRLERLGTAYPLLTDIFYIQSQVNPETKQVANVLIKRGKELHSPTLMLLNAQHILFIEPVAPESTVGKLIEEARKK
jgi:hypothetical protein